MSDVDTLIANRYRVVQQIAVGGMGLVWEAQDEVLRRRVAVKQLILQPGLTPVEAALARDRVAREARITARLHHPAAVTLYDVVEHHGSPCLIMQFVPSRSLGAVLKDQHTLPPAVVIGIGAEVASALAAAHQVGVVHRDVKPGNILITDSGSAKITDFGISHATGDSVVTTTGMLSGTPAYLAPEVARGGQSGFPSDVHSLGATLYAALEGTPPFGTDDNPIALLHRVASGRLIPPRQSGEISGLLLRMMSVRPGDRPTMPEVVDELETRRQRHSGASSVRPTAVLPAAATTPLASAAPAAPVAAVPTAAAGIPPDPPRPDRTGVQPDQPDRTGVQPDRTGARPPLMDDLVDDAPLGPATAGHRRTAALIGGLAIVLIAVVLAAFLAFRDPGGGNDTATQLTVAGSSAPGSPGETSAPVAAASTVESSPPDSSPAEVTSGSSSAAQPPAEAPLPSTPVAAASTTPATEGPSTSAESTSAEPTSSPVPEVTQAVAPPASEPAAPEDGPPSDAELAAALTDYYALMPANTDEGWNRLTERFQTGIARDRAYYERFWGRVALVTVSDVTGQAPGTVTATVTYSFTDGTRSVEPTTFTLVEEDGILKIDDSDTG